MNGRAVVAGWVVAAGACIVAAFVVDDPGLLAVSIIGAGLCAVMSLMFHYGHAAGAASEQLRDATESAQGGRLDSNSVGSTASKRSRQWRAFAGGLGVGAALLVVSVIVYHAGGRTEGARQLGAAFKWAGYAVVVATALMRWKGPWREPYE